MTQGVFMAFNTFEAKDLFQWLVNREDITVVDVRNSKEFKRFHMEGPYPFNLLNISYYDFMEFEEDSVAKIPRDRPVRIVCAQEGSARYVVEILQNHGYTDVGYLSGGIKTWGNLLVPRQISTDQQYKLFQFIRPGKGSCSYGLMHGNEMMLFDPSRNLDFYLEFAAEKGCMITKTFETHLQADYIAGSRDIARQTGADFYANDGDFKDSKNHYISLQDGEIHTFSFGGPTVRVLFTPGHTPGSTSFIIDERFLVSGDMIFINSVGRPDLGGKADEWAALLFRSIQNVKQLDPCMLVLPGHYIDWIEANEELIFALELRDVLARNKDIYELNTLEAFVTFIKTNIRPQPEEYTIIRQVNAHLREEEDERQEELDLGKNECAASAYAQQQEAGRR
jgi:glyoxylase-like metal-dependent hydrolase (beta-lactamase superfamily II)/rhodanese-related sulfurtransferase